MDKFILVLIWSISIIVFTNLSYYNALGKGGTYWSNKQLLTLKLAIFVINITCLIAGLLLCVFSKNGFSDQNICIAAILVFAGFVLNTIIVIILFFVGKKKLFTMLERNIITTIQEKRFILNKDDLLKLCKNENRFVFDQKDIEKIFEKIYNRLIVNNN